MTTKLGSLFVGLLIAGAASANAADIGTAGRGVNEYGRSSAIAAAANVKPVLAQGRTVDEDGRSNDRTRQPDGDSATVLTATASVDKGGRG